MMELGSEFWLNGGADANAPHNCASSAIYLLSGRTALDYIIKDIKAEKRFSSIAMPSYCCESMIAPFTSNGVEVVFYDVTPYDGGIKLDYDSSNEADAVLLLDYFGYQNPALAQLAKHAKAAGKIVIYDGTHKLNGHAEAEAFADYTFCSYRKWFYANAASAEKHMGRWNSKAAFLSRNIPYENARNGAAELKQDYIAGMPVNKRTFLGRFAQAEELLDSDYADYAAEPASIERLLRVDMKAIAKKRRSNAKRLVEGLLAADMPWMSIPFGAANDDDCPLFVPILVESTRRATVKQGLIAHNIFCPIHWPLSTLHDRYGVARCDRNLYQAELSLVCDQRYGPSDMDRVVETLKTIEDMMR